jgi:hypothetical protein
MWPVSHALGRHDFLVACVEACASVIQSLLIICRCVDSERLLAFPELLKSLTTILCRGTMSPNYEVSTCCIDLIGLLGTKDVLSQPLNAVLTNSLLRRLIEPAAFAMSRARFVDKSLLVINACLSSLIDLHASDNLDILPNFVKLDSMSKIYQVAGNFLSFTLSQQNHAAIMSLSANERDAFEETLGNIRSFLEYKQQAIQQLM